MLLGVTTEAGGTRRGASGWKGLSTQDYLAIQLHCNCCRDVRFAIRQGKKSHSAMAVMGPSRFGDAANAW